MNYFQFYKIPVSLDVDEQALKSKFYVKSKESHPDFFTLDGVEKQMEALELSTLNNTAYKVLVNFDKRLHYLLTIKNILGEEGKNTIPQDFLMEMMDVNEAVMELQFDFDKAAYDKLLLDVKSTKEDLRSSIKELIPRTEDELAAEDYQKLKDYYLKSKYLIRLEENIKKLEA
jgi:molecular chaperone HscB